MSSLVQDDADDAVVEAPTLEEEILRDMFAVWIDLFLSGNHGTVLGQSWDSHGWRISGSLDSNSCGGFPGALAQCPLRKGIDQPLFVMVHVSMTNYGCIVI